MNYLWNDTTVCACDHFGCGTSWSVLDGKRRPIEAGEREFTIRNGKRLIYVKDRKTGEYYAANRNYTKLSFDVFECHVGLGYQRVISQYKGVRTEFTVLVPRVGNVVEFLRGENKGVFVDGKKMDGLLVPKEKECCVKVIY